MAGEPQEVRVYADTSWWMAYKCRDDLHHLQAIRFFDVVGDRRIVWTPWHRVEVFNAYRQAERVGLIKQGESRQMIRLVEQEVRIGYWTHMEFSWVDAVRTACELSAEHSLRQTVRGMDLFHVAIAIEVAADEFLTFDDDQKALATAAGIPLARLK